MKRFLLAICFAMMAAGAIAQSYGSSDHTITFGLTGGSSFADLHVASPYKEDIFATESYPASIGLTADFKINDYFSIMPGIAYAGKGGNLNGIYGVNFDGQVQQVDIDDDYKLHYLEVPVNFIAHLPFESGANIFLGAGPYFAYALNGTNKQQNFDQTQTQHIKFGSNGDFKSTDYGITSVVGFQAGRGWSVGLNFDYGLANILQNNTTGMDVSSVKTFAFYLSVGQRF